MKRAAFLVVSMALVILLALVRDTTGATAILFTFVGMPLLASGVILYGVLRWREGAFSARRDRSTED
jgi:hypothetical protein